MKRQSDRRQSGFTLFEIMLVISIIGIFFTITLRTNWNPRNNSEKVNLLSVAIAGRLRNEIQAISIGRMPKRDGNTATETRITIGTGGLITRYYSGATEISSGVFLMPFFEGDRKYELARVTWTGATNASHQVANNTGILIITPSGISFSGITNIENNTLLEIRPRYGNASRIIEIDRRTGRISEKKF